ncbi:MAG: phenylalanine--tRNA ligase subunit alpha [Zetaproteobacteria bacterium]|nr:MAG: phenylalanine--tRNA ligase subunit alpha [Zetaproteobacteria bacterium]
MTELASLRTQLEQLRNEAMDAIAGAGDLARLQQVRVAFLGRKGSLTEVLKGVGRLDPAARPLLGKDVNRLKETLNKALAEREQELRLEAERARIEAERVDVTLPGRCPARGALHPLQQGLDEITEIFLRLGFRVAEGPEIEDEFHNFDALNIPPEHPARAMHDTFFFPDGHLLRTHTSPVQIRAMRRLLADGNEPPVAIVAPGRVYRCDYDMTHSPMFHQVEVFQVGEGISMAHLKGVLKHFLTRYFGRDLPIRLRPSYFPFTEPSAEVDIGCVFCDGAGCRVCKQSGWLEVLGSGMIHPHVLRAVDIDAARYSGYAFGLGVERLVMLKHGIPDLRLFFENDVRFLRRMGS